MTRRQRKLALPRSHSDASPEGSQSTTSILSSLYPFSWRPRVKQTSGEFSITSQSHLEAAFGKLGFGRQHVQCDKPKKDCGLLTESPEASLNNQTTCQYGNASVLHGPDLEPTTSLHTQSFIDRWLLQSWEREHVWIRIASWLLQPHKQNRRWWARGVGAKLWVTIAALTFSRAPGQTPEWIYNGPL